MGCRTRVIAALLLVLPCALGAEQPPTGDAACNGFKWDVSRERALFATPPLPLAAAVGGEKAPAVRPERLYRLQLVPSAHISFPVTPGKTPSEGSYGGVLRLMLPSPGLYRIAVDEPLWVDVAVRDRLVPPTDYEGQHSCNAPRKVVEFDLEGTQSGLLQLSGSAQAGVGLVIVGVRAAAGGAPR